MTRKTGVPTDAIEGFVKELQSTELYEVLLATFKYYAATCTLSNVPQCEQLSQAGFVRICKEAGMYGKNLTRPMAEVIFMDHVVAAAKKEEVEDCRLSMDSFAHGTLSKLKPKATSYMSFDSFIRALGSCANLKFGKGFALSRAMSDPTLTLTLTLTLIGGFALSRAMSDPIASMMRLVTEFILPKCTNRLDAFLAGDALFHSPQMEALLDMYDEPLKALFVAYCTIDCRSCPRWEMATEVDKLTGTATYGLSFIQFWELMKDFELSCVREGIQPQVARHQVAYVFMCANRAGMKADEDQTIINYEEFREVLCRVAVFFILPAEERENITPEKLADAVMEVFARMDGSPGMMKCTLHYGGTNTGHLRLVQDQRRRPDHGYKVLKDEKTFQRKETPARYQEEGVKALHDDAFPSDGGAPLYVYESLHMKPGGPPWRDITVAELNSMREYDYKPSEFSYATPYKGKSDKTGEMSLEATPNATSMQEQDQDQDY